MSIKAPIQIALVVLTGSAAATAALSRPPRQEPGITSRAAAAQGDVGSDAQPKTQTLAAPEPEEEPFDAEKHAAGLIRALEDTGDVESDFGARSDELFAAWRRSADPELAASVNFDAARCHRGGCYLRGYYQTEDALERMTLHLYTGAVFGAFRGNLARSAPLQSVVGGRKLVSAVWVTTPVPE